MELRQQEKKQIHDFMNQETNYKRISLNDDQVFVMKINHQKLIKNTYKTQDNLENKLKQEMTTSNDIYIINKDLKITELMSDILEEIVKNLNKYDEIIKVSEEKINEILDDQENFIDNINIREYLYSTDEELKLIEILEKDKRYNIKILDKDGKEFKVFLRTDGVGPDCLIIDNENKKFIRTPYGRKRESYYSLNTVISSVLKKIGIESDNIGVYKYDELIKEV